MNDDQTEEEKGVFALHDAVAELRTERALAAPPCSALSALAFSLADKIDDLRKVESSAFLRPAHDLAIRLAHELCNHENSSFRLSIRISEPNTEASRDEGEEKL